MIAQQKMSFIGQAPSAELLARNQAQMFPIYELNYRKWLPADRSARMLDFGCGYGTFLSYLHGLSFKSIEGYDPDPRCAAFTRSQGIPVSEGEAPREFLLGNAGRFDLVSVMSVAQYFERSDLVGWFTALRDALKPGGTLVLSVTNSAGVFGLTDQLQDPYMKAAYTDILLADLCHFAGLEVEELGGLKIPSKGLKRFAWLAARSLWTRLVKLIYLLERGNSERNPRNFDGVLLLVAKRPL